jgi:GMP synthase (glutamine-hydrolysing)
MPKPVLILECGAVPKRFGIQDSFASMFIKTAKLSPTRSWVVDATKRSPPGDLKAFSSVIVTGSLSMVTDRPIWSRRLAKWIVKAVDGGAAVLGVCYGHQLLADAFGGQVDYHPSGLEIGTFTIKLEKGADKHPLLKKLPQEFPAQLSHSQTVLTPPKGVRILARSEHDPHQILAYSEKVVTCQFHPEFSPAVMESFLKSVADRERHTFPRPNIGIPVKQTPHASELIELFVNLSTD